MTGVPVPLLVVNADDPRVGSDWLSAKQLGLCRAQTASNAYRLIDLAGIEPVAVLSPSAEHVYSSGDLLAAGLLPNPPFDPAREVALRDLSREKGTRSSNLLSALRHRLRRQVGGTGAATDEELCAAGVARKIGARWVVDRAAYGALHAAPYDPEIEITLGDLLELFGGFAHTGSLAESMRGAVEMRRILDSDGRERVVVPRDKAIEWLSSCHGASVARRPEERRAWRGRVGPIVLAAPTCVEQVPAPVANWLLGESGHPAGAEAQTVRQLEKTLIERDDFLGLLLLARLLDGRVDADVTQSRTSAVVSAEENLG